MSSYRGEGGRVISDLRVGRVSCCRLLVERGHAEGMQPQALRATELRYFTGVGDEVRRTWLRPSPR